MCHRERGAPSVRQFDANPITQPKISERTEMRVAMPLYDTVSPLTRQDTRRVMYRSKRQIAPARSLQHQQRPDSTAEGELRDRAGVSPPPRLCIEVPCLNTPPCSSDQLLGNERLGVDPPTVTQTRQTDRKRRDHRNEMRPPLWLDVAPHHMLPKRRTGTGRRYARKYSTAKASDASPMSSVNGAAVPVFANPVVFAQ
jgi:hypothetical protein